MRRSDRAISNQVDSRYAAVIFQRVWIYRGRRHATLLGLIVLIEKVSEQFTTYRAIEIMMEGLCPYRFAHYVKLQCLIRLYAMAEASLEQIYEQLMVLQASLDVDVNARMVTLFLIVMAKVLAMQYALSSLQITISQLNAL